MLPSNKRLPQLRSEKNNRCGVYWNKYGMHNEVAVHKVIVHCFYCYPHMWREHVIADVLSVTYTYWCTKYPSLCYDIFPFAIGGGIY